jgi:hypothetical protein
MDTILNIFGLFFMVSGMAAWAIASMVYVLYLMCEHPTKEE